MTIHNELTGKEQAFLLELYKCTKGNTTVQVVMADAGAPLGMDKDQSSRATEALMSFGFAEIRTLSGGIGITEDGIAEAEKMGAVPAGDRGPKLAKKDILDEKGRAAVDKMLTELKLQIGELRLSYETLSELLTDIKTIEVQLLSPRPKTPLIRECFVSIRALLEKEGKIRIADMLKYFIGE